MDGLGLVWFLCEIEIARDDVRGKMKEKQRKKKKRNEESVAMAELELLLRRGREKGSRKTSRMCVHRKQGHWSSECKAVGLLLLLQSRGGARCLPPPSGSGAAGRGRPGPPAIPLHWGTTGSSSSISMAGGRS